MLVAQRIVFMKLFALPRGRQKAVIGAVVNVPSNVPSTVSTLPITPAKAGLIPLKLKRRLQYKGCHAAAHSPCRSDESRALADCKESTVP